MPNHHYAQTLSTEQFQDSFSLVKPLILAEWQDIQEETLDITEGDLELIVEHIANQTERTRTLIRRQLTELYQIAVSEQSVQVPENKPEVASSTGNSSTTNTLKEAILPSLEKSLHLLERRAEKLLTQMDKEILPKLDQQIKETPEIRDRLQDRPATSLLAVFGVGLIVGLIFGGFGRGR